MSRQREVRGEQHRGARNDGAAALHQTGERNPIAEKPTRDPADAAQAEQHPERGAMGGRCERREAEQRVFLEGRNPVRLGHQNEQGQHRKPGEDIREQHAGEPGKGGGEDQQQPDPEQATRLAQSQHPQRQLQDPQRRQRLQCEIEPEARTFAEMQIEPEHGRAARDQVTLVPAREIPAGVPLQKRIAVPQRRRDQKKGDDDDGDPDRTGLGRTCAQDLRVADASVPHLDPPSPKIWLGRYSSIVAERWPVKSSAVQEGSSVALFRAAHF